MRIDICKQCENFCEGHWGTYGGIPRYDVCMLDDYPDYSNFQDNIEGMAIPKAFPHISPLDSGFIVPNKCPFKLEHLVDEANS